MQVRPDASDVARAVVETDYSPVDDTIMIVSEKFAGNGASIAVAFEDQNGRHRRGVLGLRKDSGNTWRPNGGFVGSVRPTSDTDVWMTWGGWGGDSHEPNVLGGWIADPAAVTARATEPVTGRTLDEVVENGVALFMYSDDFGARYARLDLLDADGRTLRSGPLSRRP